MSGQSARSTVTLSLGEVGVRWRGDRRLIEQLRQYWTGSLDVHHESADSEWDLDLDRPEFNGSMWDAVVATHGAIIKQSLARGIPWLHASAFRLGEATVAVTGPEAAGKTVWLLSALFERDAAFVANDAVPLTGSSIGATARRWRPDIKLRPDTLALFGRKGPAGSHVALWLVTDDAREAADLAAWGRRWRRAAAAYDEPPPRLETGSPSISHLVILRDGAPTTPRSLQNEAAAAACAQAFADRFSYTVRNLDDWETQRGYWPELPSPSPRRNAKAIEAATVIALLGHAAVFEAAPRTDLAEIRRFLGRLP